ncbi:UTP--glucose-1-phosphate uridylyltransferase [Candidatus Woesearchaeota archaeon]|nr:UTP--glucose-1-phosphate uridylyltransferase [Candidatus Woesearchaeota archaeon]
MNIEEIKKALLTQPEWVTQRAIQNAKKYEEGTLITKYEAKNIQPLKEEDIIKPRLIIENKKKEIEKKGIQHLKESKYAYFVMAGGISTSMGGCSKAILNAKQNKTFLEIKLDHIRKTQKKYDCKIPVIIMTNEETDKSITEFLEKENRLQNIDLIKIIQPVTIRFEEQENKTRKELNVAKQKNGEISYAPGGHYDAFTLLKEIKQELKQKGIQTIFINNIDNLGATINPLLLGIHLKEESLFTPEISRKEPNDKGGTFARISNKLRLLEGPMVPKEYEEQFNDTNTNKYFNTNLIYLDTKILDYYEEINNQIPTFINKKKIDEKEMIGFEAAIGLIFGIKPSKLIEVKRQQRFLPIKYLSDLWLLRSNFMKLQEETSAVHQIKEKKPIMKIPETFLKNLEDFEQKIADGGETTNFEELEELKWDAKDGKIGRNVTFKGKITITEQNHNIKDNEVITQQNK